MVPETSFGSACRSVAKMLLIAGFALLPAGVTSAFAQDATALQWFKAEVPEGAASAQYRWAIDPSALDSEYAELTIVTDDHCSLYVNGQRILKNVALKQADGNVEAAGYNVKSLLRQGRNLIAVEVNSQDKVAVFGLSLSARKGNDVRNIGGGWKKAPAMPPVGWQQTDFNDRDWPEVKTVADEPGNRFKVSMPTAFAAPVIPAKARTAPFQFEDGDRVVFVGATFFERAQLSEHLEATLAGTLGGKHVTFRNLGWSADTTYADSRGIFDRPEVGYLRMVEHIRAEEPTVAMICYGQNEALTAGLTPEQYSEQLGRLLDELTASGIACVLVSPHELLPAAPPVPSPSRFNSRESRSTPKRPAVSLNHAVCCLLMSSAASRSNCETSILRSIPATRCRRRLKRSTEILTPHRIGFTIHWPRTACISPTTVMLVPRLSSEIAC
jgi:hypothetical protein